MEKGRAIVNAIFARILLFLHSMLMIWRAADVRNNNLLWLLGLVNLVLLAETIYIVIQRKGQERKWFCPCFPDLPVLYITCCMVTGTG
ncbi:hypothetical protein KUTeg_004475 [Tegillarca granosa]|uniref:Uncharacterized protein n=1 Tax=Tegillarca granosa TaxID=220873 RepID=A0ABQ9FQ24_TEGGR|nr:hypothetical protein KUTeg_004475 [Tegillarca granosa]